ncbi:MAG: hypothetical protein JNK40_02745 [Chromatiales bacterium]|nr:hypothetical protein [Chromatiales bacterium]
MQRLNTSEVAAIEANLFAGARRIVREQPDFPWHRDSRGAVTATQPNSSQALAVDLFGTIDVLSSRNAIVDAWMADMSLTLAGPWTIELEALLPRELLGERRQTQMDALAIGITGIAVFECKFTEPDGGGCSQPVPLSRGAHGGMRQCDGNFRDQVNPVNNVRAPCALTGKGIRYWDLIPDVLAIDPTLEHRPCPFSGGWYQWMRNLVAASALGRTKGLPAAVVVVYADGPFPMAWKVGSGEWHRLNELAAGRQVPLRTVSYQHLLVVAANAAQATERALIDQLSAWMEAKYATVAAIPEPTA